MIILAVFFTIIILDENDNFPVFDPDVKLANFSVIENINIGFIFGFLRATDADKDDRLTYSIE